MTKFLLDARHREITEEKIKAHKMECRNSSQEIERILKKEHKEAEYAEKLAGGLCNHVYKILVNGEVKVLKIAEGIYRSVELKREMEILKYLVEEGYTHIIPQPGTFKFSGEYAYLIEEYVTGTTVKVRLNNVENKQERLEIWKTVGLILSEIHQCYRMEDRTCSWINGQLETAKINMESGLFDPEEFAGESPEQMLDWLTVNKPGRTQVSLLHGDYRTKNIMVDEYNNYKVIDWGFVDIGDPYYDLAIIDYYFQDNLDRDSFYGGYKENPYSKQFIEYYGILSKFINV